MAGEAGVPFFYRAGSEFEELYVGVGARRMRALFQVRAALLHSDTSHFFEVRGNVRICGAVCGHERRPHARTLPD